jgi:hypothetical protein
MASDNSEETFSVCQFFKDGSWDYVERYVDSERAVTLFRYYTKSVGAKIGTTVRIIITDGGDCTNMEWQFGKGLTYPPELVEKWKRGEP